jgi:two-component system, LuxR family, sensor kinase FixL
MGELTASLAHELNQPLTAILNNTQAAQLLLAAKVVNLEKIGRILDDIVADEKRAAGVIHGLRAMLRKGDSTYASLDLNEVISEVARLFTSDAIVRNVPISLELAADLPSVRGNRIQLQQVVLNLVLNGLEATPESTEGGRSLVIRTTMDGAGTIKIEVQDSGSGIEETDMDRLFQPLYTTKAQGLGMGLAIVRTIVEAHGGRLGAVNNERGGATFQVTVPVDTETKG